MRRTDRGRGARIKTSDWRAGNHSETWEGRGND